MKELKMIYLDVDGVLNFSTMEEKSPHGCIGIDSHKCNLIHYICEKTGAKVGLTSTWQHVWNDPDDTDGIYIRNKFEYTGIPVIKTVPYSGWGRGKAIADDVKKNNVKHWVVIDDDMWPDFEDEGILPHFVKTDYYKNGITNEQADYAIKILTGEERKE